MPEPAADLASLTSAVLDELLERHPESASALGVHDYDGQLDDQSPDAQVEELAWAQRRLTDLEAVELDRLEPADVVDTQMLINALRARCFDLTDVCALTWDPLLANPGGAVYSLLARDFAPLADRLRSVAGRLAGVPARLEGSRESLAEMPRVHVETAIGQLAGTRTLLAVALEKSLVEEPALRAEVEPVRAAALEALDVHVQWLRSRLDSARGDPRLGAECFSRKLALTLDTASDADSVLARAEADLARIEDAIAETASRLDDGPAEGQVRRVLDRLASEGHVDNESIVAQCVEAMATTTAFVRTADLVTVHDDPVEVIVMPEIHRGVAVAYCDPPGPLETTPLPTYYAVSPTPEDWPEDQVRSFFLEYNAHMLQNLTVHEAMPGHVLQLAHSQRYAGRVPVRKALWSGTFVEGWAVYAEELMVGSGYRSDEGQADALRMQQLKMQLRMTINAILDARVHAHGMTEAEAMALMTGRGHQEEGEAVGKWRRSLLSSGQLSTYYVGYVEVADIARDLAAARPKLSVRQRHDTMLAHGSPSPRHLRTLLDL